jgi:hypothetical protein
MLGTGCLVAESRRLYANTHSLNETVRQPSPRAPHPVSLVPLMASSYHVLKSNHRKQFG